MNQQDLLQIVGRVKEFLGRHSLAFTLTATCGITVAALCAVWTIAYLVLVLGCMFIGGGFGGPLTYPVGLVACVVVGIGAWLAFVGIAFGFIKLAGRGRGLLDPGSVERTVVRIVARAGGILGRHSLACVVMVSVLCAIWTVTYFALLLYAMVIGGGIGGPLAYPAGLVACLFLGTVACLMLFFPSTALAEWAANRKSWPVLAQIPISVAILALICFAISAAAVARSDQSMFSTAGKSSFVLWIVHLVPLGLYWWTAQSGPLVLSLGRSVFSTARSLVNVERVAD